LRINLRAMRNKLSRNSHIRVARVGDSLEWYADWDAGRPFMASPVAIDTERDQVFFGVVP